MQRSGAVYKSALCWSVHWFLSLSCVSEVPALSPSSGRKQHIFFPHQQMRINSSCFFFTFFLMFAVITKAAPVPAVNNNQYPAWFWDILAHTRFFQNSLMLDLHFSFLGKTSAGRLTLLVSDWSEEDVSSWLVEEGLKGLVDKFLANNIDGTELLSLTKETLASELHIGEEERHTHCTVSAVLCNLLFPLG